MKNMLQTVVLLASLLACAGAADAQVDEPVVARLDSASQEKTRALNPEYLVYAPKGKPEGKLPLLIYLHGSGGRGDDVRRLQAQTRRVLQGIAQFDKGPCFVAAPQCLRTTKQGERGIWQPADLDVLLEHLKATLPIDVNRVYLTGNSMGGYGAWAWGASSPQHFAAIAPVVGGIGPGGPKDVTPDLEKWAVSLAKVPVYAFAGGKDRVVPAERSERMIAAIRKAGGKQAKLMVYPDEGHGAGRLVFASEAFYDWMFTKKRE